MARPGDADDVVARALSWARRLGACGAAGLAAGDQWLAFAPRGLWPDGLVFAVALVSVDGLAGARARRRLGTARVTLATCAADLVIAVAAVVVLGADGFAASLVLLAVPTLEAAVRFRVAGALGAVGLAAVVWGCHAMLVGAEPWAGLAGMLVPTAALVVLAVPVGYLADRLVDELVRAEQAAHLAERRAHLAGVLAVAGAGLRRRRPLAETVRVLGGAVVHLGAEAVEVSVETVGRRQPVYRRGGLDPGDVLTVAEIPVGPELTLTVTARLADDALTQDAFATLVAEARHVIPVPTSRGSLATRLERYLATPNRGWLALVRVAGVTGDPEALDRRVRLLRRRGHVTGRLGTHEWAVVVAGAQAEGGKALVAALDAALQAPGVRLRYRLVLVAPSERVTTTELLGRARDGANATLVVTR